MLDSVPERRPDGDVAALVKTAPLLQVSLLILIILNSCVIRPIHFIILLLLLFLIRLEALLRCLARVDYDWAGLVRPMVPVCCSSFALFLILASAFGARVNAFMQGRLVSEGIRAHITLVRVTDLIRV